LKVNIYMVDLTPILVRRSEFQAPPNPQVQPGSKSINLDFTTEQHYAIQFEQSQGSLGSIKSIIMDNSKNPNDVIISVSGTNQLFTFPKKGVGVAPIVSWPTSTISFYSLGGATALTNTTLNNFSLPASITQVA